MTEGKARSVGAQLTRLTTAFACLVSMAPILHRREMLNELETRVIRSVVVVKLFVRESESSATGKRKRDNLDMQLVGKTHYKAFTGFIVDSTRGSVFVVVPSCKIDTTRGDIVRVVFHGGITREASVFIGRTTCNRMVLEVQNAPPGCTTVNFHIKLYHRGDVFVLTNEGGSGLNSYSTNVIHPDTSSYGFISEDVFSKTKIKGSAECFTLNLIGTIFDTLGAPVFDMTGLLAGTIINEYTEFAHLGHIKYARHASYFAPGLVDAIQKQKAKVEKSKVASGE